MSEQKRTQFNCTFAITNTGDVVIINHDAPEGFVDDYEPLLEGLGSNLTDKPGAYRGVVDANVFMCNHYQDPVEWDIDYTLQSFQELVFTELEIRKAVLSALNSAPSFSKSIGLEGFTIEVFRSKVAELQNEIINNL